MASLIALLLLALTSVTLGALDPGSDDSRFIYHGLPAKPGQIPYHAVLGWDRGANFKLGCGGVLIDSQHVVTAGHCMRPTRTHVLLGSVSLPKKEPGTQVRSVAAARVNYTGWYGERRDFAVLKLNEPVVFTSRIQPIRIRQEKPTSGMQCRLAGFGATEKGSTGHLRYADVPTVSDKVCAADFLRFSSGAVVTPESEICAGDRRKGSCGGDSGGPLACTVDGGGSELVGVVSWSPTCGRTYSAFAEIYFFLDWLERAMRDMQ